MTRINPTTIRLDEEDQERLDRIRKHYGEVFGLAKPAPQSAVFRKLLREEHERLEKAELERTTGNPRGR